ncbi:MAG: alginate export family protein [Candidatus Omnitrophica bacterium]|nr:alginate export family protein [Candidatus Omnitrophota bacterium]MDE2008453.1 alginate export family protein [Candidatus Omnitrophota bacterium]
MKSNILKMFRFVITGMFLSGALFGSQAWAGDYLNQYLPDYLKADVEFRYRLEYRDNMLFNKAKDDAGSYDLFRTRVGLTYNPIKEVTLFAQGQDARVSGLSTQDKSEVAKSTLENLWDIRQLYGRYEQGPITIQGGRQEFAYGAERLIGAFNWSNVAQTFDGGKVGFHIQPLNLQLDLLAGDKTGYRSPQSDEANDLFDASAKDRMYAYYATAHAFHGTLIENYLIHRVTWKNISFGPNGSGRIDDYTFGGRLKNKLPYHFDYEMESAGQWGDFDHKRVCAAMFVGILGYTLDLKWQPRLAFEYDYGSGGKPNGKTLGTFDNLYPTNHLFYGYMDLFSLQNINDYRYQVSIKPAKNLKLQTDFHMVYLDTTKDALYSAARTVTRTTPAGLLGVSSHVGNELDLTGDYKLNKYLSFQAGYCHLFPGEYLKDTGPHNGADFAFFQTTLAF